MKVRISGAEREQRRQLIADLCAQLDAELVQAVGHTALIYRERRE
jgi:RNA-binding protein